MKMVQSLVVEESDSKPVIIYEPTDDEGVWKARDRHGVIIEGQSLINIELVILDLLFTPRLFIKCSQSKLSVVDEGDGELGASTVLLDLLELDVAGLSAPEHLLEG
jgi:hypothetical protein